MRLIIGSFRVLFLSLNQHFISNTNSHQNHFHFRHIVLNIASRLDGKRLNGHRYCFQRMLELVHAMTPLLPRIEWPIMGPRCAIVRYKRRKILFGHRRSTVKATVRKFNCYTAVCLQFSSSSTMMILNILLFSCLLS